MSNCIKENEQVKDKKFEDKKKKEIARLEAMKVPSYFHV